MAKEQGIKVIWKSFELRPPGVEVPPKSPEYMARAWKNVDVLAKEYGLTMTRNTESKHSRNAHEGAKFAEHHKKGDEYIKAVFEAQWHENKDVDDIEVLTQIAGNIGLDGNAFRTAIEQHTYVEGVLQDESDANRMGIHSIPCFIVGAQGVMGVQSRENLLQMLTGHTF